MTFGGSLSCQPYGDAQRWPFLHGSDPPTDRTLEIGMNKLKRITSVVGES